MEAELSQYDWSWGLNLTIDLVTHPSAKSVFQLPLRLGPSGHSGDHPRVPDLGKTGGRYVRWLQAIWAENPRLSE